MKKTLMDEASFFWLIGRISRSCDEMVPSSEEMEESLHGIFT